MDPTTKLIQQKFLPRLGPKWLSLAYRCTLLIVALSALIVSQKEKGTIDWIHICDWGLFLSIICSIFGICHYLFLSNKNESIFTEIYAHLFITQSTMVPSYTIIVWINNLISLNLIDEKTCYLTIIEHVLLGLMIYVPFQYEYIEIRWFPYYYTVAVLFIAYVGFNMCYVFVTGRVIYNNIDWKNWISYVFLCFLIILVNSVYFVGWWWSRFIQKRINWERWCKEFEEKLMLGINEDDDYTQLTNVG